MFFLMVLEIEHKALHMLGKCCTTELHLQSYYFLNHLSYNLPQAWISYFQHPILCLKNINELNKMNKIKSEMIRKMRSICKVSSIKGFGGKDSDIYIYIYIILYVSLVVKSSLKMLQNGIHTV
jgi:hypothetical protein